MFRHMQTGQMYELVTTGENPEIVETVPGWTHDITNIVAVIEQSFNKVTANKTGATSYKCLHVLYG